MSKRGLPAGVRMRHDSHYVEELAGQQRTGAIGRLISVDLLDPNPEQPRVEIGDLTDLSASIKDRGVLEPLLVKATRLTGRWMIIAGERRWRAACAAGLREVPCIEMEVDERGVAEIALIENMQRKDLTAWEEADGLLALCERFGYTHEDVAKKVGKSRTTVTEALSIAGIPEGIREECRRADIHVKSLLLQVVRQPDLDSMQEMVRQIASRGLKRDGARAVRRAQSFGETSENAKPYTFKHQLLDEGVRIEIRFKKSGIGRAEILKTLRLLIEDISKQELAVESDKDNTA